MIFLPSLCRHRQPEIMDQPGLDAMEHRRALGGLERINIVSGSDRILWRPIARLARERQPLRVLDIASGGGDVSLRLSRRARKAGLKIEFSGCDVSATAVEHARTSATRLGESVEFFTLDALNAPWPDGFDVITCSLFLHHLDDDEAIQLLRKMRESARRLVLVNDLCRSRLGYVVAWLGTRILSSSPIVHVDGPLSVRAAFTRAEASRLANQAGLLDAKISRRWPFRFLLEWRRPA